MRIRILSWLGAILLVVAVAAGTASALRLHTQSSHVLTASGLAVAAAPGSAPAAGGPQANPSPSPAVTPAAHHAAAPARTPVKSAGPATRSAAPPSIVVRSTEQALINQDRARHGLRQLTWSSCLASIAYSNAVRMATAEAMWHTNGASLDLTCNLGYHAGENIGYWTGGVNDSQLNTMFMNSPEHRANILSPYYHYVATAWKTAANGTAYIAVEFS